MIKASHILFFLLPLTPAFAQLPGEGDYPHREVIFTDSAQAAGGFWIFEPAGPRPDSAALVVFLHGFGDFNPMIYGQWFRHLARKGNVVVVPRYQTGLWDPKRSEFTGTAAHAIRKALQYLDQNSEIRLKAERPVFIGHSYGGVLAANMAIQYRELGVPKPAAIMLCQPGTNVLTGGRLPEYQGFPDDLKLLVIVSQNDPVVGRRFGKMIYNAASNVASRDLLLMRSDPRLETGHSACYAVDLTFDNGVRTFSARNALSRPTVDAADFDVLWKLADGLISHL